MSASSNPSLCEITRALAVLADRVVASNAVPPEPFVSQTLRVAVNALQGYVPGLDPPPDAEAAQGLLRGAETALHRGDEREAFSRAVRGLSFAPHDPRLWYLAATACFELGGVEDSLRLLYHTLWIHPGYAQARQDLEDITSWLEEEDDDES